MEEWYKQRKVQENPQNHNLLELGLSTFFLNRTNRSGIITGGVIGGKDQSGDWKLDCRFNKNELISRIKKISQHKKQISLYNQDAQIFIRNILPSLSEKSLVYFDPPYYVKGQNLLYLNFYEPEDHVSIARLISKLKYRWIISYDNVPEIRTLYKDYRSLSYVLHYAAQDKYQGKEILYFCHNLIIPKTENPQFIAMPSLRA
jgi:DNA adenine methylase